MKEYEDAFADTTKRDNGTSFHAGMDAYYRDRDLRAKSPYIQDLELVGWGRQIDLWKPREPQVANWVHDAIAWSEEHLEPRLSLIESEVYVAFNFANGLHHVDAEVRDRKYPKMPGYLPGTCDVVGVLLSGRLLVADWKTGGGTGADKQLLTLALGLREEYRAPDGSLRPVTLAVLYAGSEGVRPHEWEVTNEELEQHRIAMHLQLVDVGVRTEPVPGTHCHNLYCNHLAYCPGISAIVDDAAESPEGLLPAKQLARKFTMGGEFTSAQHAGYVMSRVTAAKRQLDYHSARVKRHLANGGKVLADDLEFSNGPNGHRWKPKK